MKIEFINPFIKAATMVLKTAAQIESQKGALKLRKTSFASDEITAIIGIVGDIEGQVIYTLSESDAMKFASAMMMGMPVTEFDEMAKSAISELCNMITGNASTDLAAQGFKCNISPPTILTGGKVEISTIKIPIISIPLSSDNGNFEINVALRSK
jgi:chemotaxis protein CheX